MLSRGLLDILMRNLAKLFNAQGNASLALDLGQTLSVRAN